MTTIPGNLTLVRSSFRDPGSLKTVKDAMLAAPTDYVMAVGPDDLVDVLEPLTGDVHYLATHVGTANAYRYSRPVLDYDPLLLTQFNYLGSPILHRSLVPLFPEAAVEPWHTVMLRAQAQGADFSLVSGGHMIIEPWPRPKFSGAFAHFRTSFDPTAVMQVLPGILVTETNQRPFYSLLPTRSGPVAAYCRDCTPGFMSSLEAPGVSIHQVTSQDLNLMCTSNAEYVAWFDGMAETANSRVIEQLQVALEFPGVAAVSPRLVEEFTPSSYHMAAFWLKGGLYSEFSSRAWMLKTTKLSQGFPVTGCTNSHAILRKLP